MILSFLGEKLPGDFFSDKLKKALTEEVRSAGHVYFCDKYGCDGRIATGEM